MSKPTSTAHRIATLRMYMQEIGILGVLIPHSDTHQNEFLSAEAERLAWITGFTGSAGFSLILKDSAVLFVDGRYTVQAKEEVDAKIFSIEAYRLSEIKKWIFENIPEGSKIGFDPWLQTEKEIATYQTYCDAVSATLTPLETNPIDAIWMDQPAPPSHPIKVHESVYAGTPHSEKIAAIAGTLQEEGIQGVILSSLESIAWLLNLRGNDLPVTPVFSAYAILYQDKSVDLFIDMKKLSPAVRNHLKNDVQIHDYADFRTKLVTLSQGTNTFQVDPQTTSYTILATLNAGNVTLIKKEDPCILPKACKNNQEIKGMRDCHIRDGAALVTFLAWLDRTLPHETITEIGAAEKLLSLRQMQDLFQNPSFYTISSIGPHGAIVHYRASPKTDQPLTPDQLYLLDSGGQYLDGTTDVTRTLPVGKPSQEQIDRFTRVLKGHIALASLRFPEGITGGNLDILARQALWNVGLDYDHGTGHGVGSYLNVHEGPQNISARSSTPLKPGMVLSNEPGYYKEGEYGIRIESMMAVKPPESLPGGERDMLSFETLTLVPIAKSLIDARLLTAAEIKWLDTYHAHVYRVLSPLVDDETDAWLVAATRPL